MEKQDFVLELENHYLEFSEGQIIIATFHREQK